MGSEFFDLSNVFVPSFVSIEQTYDRDGYFVFTIRAKDMQDASLHWPEFMIVVNKFMNWIETHRRRYKFHFDLSNTLGRPPPPELHEFMKCMQSKQSILDAYLHSTTVVMRAGIVEVIVRGVLLLFPPRRPLYIETVG